MNKLMLFTLIFMALSITTKAQNDMNEKNKTEKKRHRQPVIWQN